MTDLFLSTPTSRTWSLLGLLVCLTAGPGCQEASGPRTEYGVSHGRVGSQSVNGLSCFAEMFRRSGATVQIARWLGDATDQADVIVWCWQADRLPGAAARSYLQKWVHRGEGRRLLLVGDAYRAELDYWDFVRQAAAPALQDEASWQYARIKARQLSSVVQAPREPVDVGPVRFIPPEISPSTATLAGPWSQLLPDEKSRQRPVYGTLKTSQSDRVPDPWVPLLRTADGRVLIAKYVVAPGKGDAAWVAVADGSFLFNFSLARSENWPLAEQLVRECQPARRVVFLDANRPPSFPAPRPSHPFPRVLTAPPLAAALWQALLAALLYGFAAFPIFGRPRPETRQAVPTFVEHVDALGELLTHRTQPDVEPLQVAVHRAGRSASPPSWPTQ